MCRYQGVAMARVVPENWRMLRGLLKALGAVAVFIATLVVLAPEHFMFIGPLWGVALAHLTAASAVAGAALYVRRRYPDVRFVATTVAAGSAAAAIGGVVIYVLIWNVLREPL